jgi:hypothetical protein
MPMYLNILNNVLGMKKIPENLISVINNIQVESWAREDERLLLTVSQTISGSPFECSFVNKKDKTGQSFNNQCEELTELFKELPNVKDIHFFSRHEIIKNIHT